VLRNIQTKEGETYRRFEEIEEPCDLYSSSNIIRAVK
jgi:hypothetical protein